jgi:hypothetical protein
MLRPTPPPGPSSRATGTTTQRPYDLFMVNSLSQWSFGAGGGGGGGGGGGPPPPPPDNKGDVRSAENIKRLQELGGGVQLVTADGIIDCSSDPNEQEAIVAHLHDCESVAALACMARGSHFVLKMFTPLKTNQLSCCFCCRAPNIRSEADHKHARKRRGVRCLQGFKAALPTAVLERPPEYMKVPAAGTRHLDIFSARCDTLPFPLSDESVCQEVQRSHVRCDRAEHSDRRSAATRRQNMVARANEASLRSLVQGNHKSQ